MKEGAQWLPAGAQGCMRGGGGQVASLAGGNEWQG